MSLLVFLVAYVGIGGKDAGSIDRQVRRVVDDHAEVVKISKRDQHALVVRSKRAKSIVRKLGADGVIAGEVKRTRKKATLTIVVYDGDGSMVDLLEIPLPKRRTKKLPRSDLRTVKETLLPAIERLTPAASEPEPEPEPAPEPVAKAAPVVAASVDDEDPAVLARTTETGAEADAPAPTRRARREKILRVSAGAGARSRTFDPGPAMVLGYRSSPVPGAQAAVEVRPIRYLELGGEIERTLVMSSEVGAEQVPSSILGWQGVLALRLPLGPIELAALGGVGGREFVISSSEPSGTPDGHYLYALAGARLGLRLGSRVELSAFGAYEPVIGGDDTMGNIATRAGFEVGAALQVDATSHVFVVGEGGFQRFTWTFDDGRAADSYPGATLSVGASY